MPLTTSKFFLLINLPYHYLRGWSI